MTSVRTRFAPSPTGFLHVGGIRTALFAWLLARQADGTFVLRIEDTDKNREVDGSGEHIQASLRALGLQWDEGVGLDGGPHAPYLQSERLDTYRSWAQRLIDDGRAYADPYTAEELQQFREQVQAAKLPFLYRNHRPNDPPAWDGTAPLRFKSDPKDYQWHDEVMGDMHAGAEAIDDFILIKSDGYPTYNFAHIVDDAEMNITHVIRGQEFIASTPNYLNLYEALGILEGQGRPVLATMPHILGPSGNKKLSKRDGAKDVLDYIRDGYLPETLINFIASLGWNDGTEQEIFTVDELIAKFSLDRVQRSGARFDEQRLLWMNGQWIRSLDIDDLDKRIEKFWPLSASGAEETKKRQVLTLVQDRLKTLAELPLLSSYFFEEPTVNLALIDDNKQLKKLSRADQRALLQAAHDALVTSNFDATSIQDTLNQLLETLNQKPGVLFSLIRISVTWAPFSPQLNDTIAIIGQDTTLARIERSITALA